MRRALFVLVLILAPSAAVASNYARTVNSDGYSTYAGDSYYWWGNQAYTRYLYSAPGYYSCGYYYPGSSYYRYVYSHTYYPTQTYTAPTTYPSYTDPGWRSQLLGIAAARDKAEAKIRAAAFEQRYYLETLKSLGLEGNFRWESYGHPPPYPAPGYAPPAAGYSHSYAAQAPGPVGSTMYGYSYNRIAEVYGDTNTAELFQQAARLAEGVQKLAGQATTDFSGLVGQDGAQRAKVAEILAKGQATAEEIRAKGQAAQEFLRALQGQGARVEFKGQSFKVVPGKDGKLDLEPVPPPTFAPKGHKEMPGAPAALPDDVKGQWVLSAGNKCFSCHGQGGKAEGGFDVQSFPVMTAEEKAAVIGRLTTDDPKRRMPRAADGKAGPKMPAAEIELWRKM